MTINLTFYVTATSVMAKDFVEIRLSNVMILAITEAICGRR